MKQYIKPQTEIISLSLGTNVLAALSFTANGRQVKYGGGTSSNGINDANAKSYYDDDEDDDYWE